MLAVPFKPRPTKVLDLVLPRNEMTQHREIRFIPVWIENMLGSAYYEDLYPKTKICKDEKLNGDVQAVFDDLIEQCPRKNMQPEMRVLEDDTVNAYCLPGCKVVITTGMISKLKAKYDFDKERAFSKLTKRKAFKAGFDILYRIGSYVFNKRHSQGHEFEADRFGIELAYRAKYGIRASKRLQLILMEMKGEQEGVKSGVLKKGLGVLSSHPPSKKRLQENQKTIGEINEKGVDFVFPRRHAQK